MMKSFKILSLFIAVIALHKICMPEEGLQAITLEKTIVDRSVEIRESLSVSNEAHIENRDKILEEIDTEFMFKMID